MTELEFEVLDHLYFIKHSSELLDFSTIERDKLLDVLSDLCNKKWIRVFEGQKELLTIEPNQIREKFESLSFVVTKAGLLAHNLK
jgi:hypothetical protein